MKFLFIAGYISADIVRALCWTLLHSLWQGLIAAAIAGVIILTTRHSKAVLRYNLLSIVFISFIVCTFFTFLYQPGIIGSSFNSATKINVSIIPAENFVVTDVAKNWIPTIQKKTFFQPIIYYGNKYSSLIAGIWAIFFFFHVLRMLSGLRQAYQLRYLQTFSPAQEWKERLYTLSSLVGIHSKVLLKESGIIKTPVLIGFLKPVILVPLGMFANLSVEQVETIFVHELAHIRRRDFAVNLLQRFAESFFFFNPFISWVSSLVREEREACCDDIVLEYTRDKKSYLEALVSFREADIETPQYALALGGSNSLLNRAKRILTNENKKLNVMEKVTLILVVLGITAFSFIPEKKSKTVLHPKATVINPADQLKAVKEDRFGTIQSSATVSPNDTVPSRVITFTNLSIYNNEDEKGNTREVKALGSDG
ncbi:MAG: M56 family metallopeptidase, partial [Bacteroidota bacterium]